ncbi:MAG: hypothetical protein R3F43_06035 [bacterium]
MDLPARGGDAHLHRLRHEPLHPAAAPRRRGRRGRARLRGGALRLVGRSMWTPVCLAMGAALLAMPWDEALHLCPSATA